MNKTFRRFLVLALASAAGFALPAPVAFADLLPNSDGKLDYGLEGLDIPPIPRVNHTSPRTVQLLGEAFAAATTTGAKVQFLMEIGYCQLPQSVSLIAAATGDTDPAVRAAACNAAALLARSEFQACGVVDAVKQNRELVARLEKMLAQDTDSRCRIASLDALVAIQGTSSPALAAAARQTADPALSAHVIQCILQAPSASVPASQQSSAAQASLIAALWPSLPQPTRLLAAKALGRVGDASSVTLVLPLLKEDVPARVAALQALRDLKAQSQLPAVQSMLGDASPSVRRAAVAALQTLASPDVARRQGLRMLKDNDSTVRQAAVELLTPHLTPDLVAPIVSQLSDRYKPLYEAAVKTLSTATDPAVRQACINAAVTLLDNADPRRQQDGSYILGRYRSDAGLARHIALAGGFRGDKPDWALLSQVADSLGRIGRAEARPVLLQLGNLKYDSITAGRDESTIPAIVSAMIACARLGEKGILPACREALQADPQRTPSLLRAAGVFAYGVLGTPSDAGFFAGLIGGMYESDATRMEILRAVGNLRARDGMVALGSNMVTGPDMKWMAHWARQRITGENTPLVLTPELWLADVSITDLPK